MMAYAADWASIFTRYHTWLLMAGTDIGMRYRRSLLGPFWISLAMAAMVLAIGTLYAQVMNQPYEAFLSYLGCGILAWTFLSTTINESCAIAGEAERHLRSVNIPIPVLAARVVYRNAIIFFHNAIVVLGMLFVLGHQFKVEAFYALAGLAAYILFGLFVGITLGPVCARFRDLASLIASVIQITFFITPIFWVPGASVRPIVVDINPFYHLIEVIRQPLLGQAPIAANWTVVGAVLAVSGMAALVSLAVCRRRLFLWL